MNTRTELQNGMRGDIQRHPMLEQLLAEHVRVPSLFRDHPQPMVLYDFGGNIIVGNVAAIRLLGHPPGTLVGTHFSAHLAPNCVPGAQDACRLAAAGTTSDFEATFVHADGHPVNVSTTIMPARLGEDVVGIYGIVREVRLEREVAAAVEQAERFRALYHIAASSGKTAMQQITDALTLGNALLAVETAVLLRLDNGMLKPTQSVGVIPLEAFETYSIDEAACAAMFAAFDPVAVDDTARPPWDRDPLRCLMPWRSFVTTTFEIAGTFAGIVVFGSRRERGELFSTSDREFVRSISAVVGSALERQMQQERLDALAFSDTLTGLPNRALLGERLEQMIVECRRNHESFAVHFLDLDGFKHVNDTAGHADGDKVLRQTAQRLREALRESDCVARLGGDEFIVLQKHIHRTSDAIALAQTLLDVVRIPFIVDANTHILSASIGISLFPVDGETANVLIRHADVALYRAKSSGRNRWALFAPQRKTVPSVSSSMQETARE